MRTLVFFFVVLVVGGLGIGALLGNLPSFNPAVVAAHAAQLQEATRHDTAMHLMTEQLVREMVGLAPGLVSLLVESVCVGLVLMLLLIGVGVAFYLHHRGKAVASRRPK